MGNVWACLYRHQRPGALFASAGDRFVYELNVIIMKPVEPVKQSIFKLDTLSSVEVMLGILRKQSKEGIGIYLFTDQTNDPEHSLTSTAERSAEILYLNAGA